LITDLHPEDQYAKASGLMQLSSSAQYLISPFIAWILLTIIDIKFIFTIDISIFLIAIVIIIRIRNTLGTNKKQGRVWAIISTITYLGSIVAFVVAGFLADKVFNPLLEVNVKLAGTVGSIIGIGEGRGIGLMHIVSGIIISLISLLIFRNKFIKKLDEK
jgi:hypothetical protein